MSDRLCETPTSQVTDPEQLRDMLADAHSHRRELKRRLAATEILIAGLTEALAALTDHPEQGALGGRRLATAALNIMRESSEPIHYLRLLEALEQRGLVIAGKQPAATLLTALHRDPRVERTGPRRSGLFRPAQADANANQSAAVSSSANQTPYSRPQPASSG